MKRLFPIFAVALSFGIGVAAQAAEYSYQANTATLSVDRNTKVLGKSEVYSGTLTSHIERVWTTLEWRNELSPQVVCPNPADEGKGDWKGFYNVPKAQKPAALAAAVKGIGQSTAQKIVALGYFSRKPRSWDEFSAEIRNADRAINSGFSRDVLVTYADENMRNLGYSDGTCNIQYVLTPVLTAVEQRAYDRSVSRNFEIQIDGSVLLNGEKERHLISFNAIEGDRISLDQSLNAYTVNREDLGSKVVYRLGGTRKLITPSAPQLNAFLQGSQVVVQITDVTYDSSLSENGKAIATVDVYLSKLFGDQKLGSVEVPLDGATKEIATGINLPSGKKGYAKVSIRRTGSAYFGSQPSAQTRSESIRPR